MTFRQHCTPTGPNIKADSWRFCASASRRLHPGRLTKHLLRLPDPFAPQAELVASTHGLVALEINLQQLFTLYVVALFVLQPCDDFSAGGVDYVTSGWVSVAAIEAEGNPARLVSHGDAGDLFWRHDCGVKNVQAPVGSVG